MSDEVARWRCWNKCVLGYKLDAIGLQPQSLSWVRRIKLCLMCAHYIFKRFGETHATLRFTSHHHTQRFQRRLCCRKTRFTITRRPKTCHIAVLLQISLVTCGQRNKVKSQVRSNKQVGAGCKLRLHALKVFWLDWIRWWKHLQVTVRTMPTKTFQPAITTTLRPAITYAPL